MQFKMLILYSHILCEVDPYVQYAYDERASWRQERFAYFFTGN